MLHCIVPLCNNHSGTPGLSFYHLPLKDPVLLKLWLIRIRRENTPVNEYSRVCSTHFKGGRKNGKKDIPCVFAWTKKTSHLPPKERVALRMTDIECQDSSLSEDDVEGPTEEFSHCPDTVDLEGTWLICQCIGLY